MAQRFDKAPEFGIKGLRYLEGEELEGIAYDDLGKTAMESIENLLFQLEEGKQKSMVSRIWSGLKKEDV